MALKTTDLFEIEASLRFEADRLRKVVAAQPGAGEAMKSLDDAMLGRARRFDQAADLVLGLQGCWEHHGGADLVRDGFKRMSRAYDQSKTYVLAVETTKAEAEAGEAAA